MRLALASDPVLPAPMLSLPGLSFPYWMSSFMFLTGSDARTTNTCGLVVRPVIGAKSFTGSYPRFLYRYLLAACAELEETMIV